MDKDSIRLVNIVPVVNGWKTAALENKREAQKLMNSGTITLGWSRAQRPTSLREWLGAY